MEKIKISVETFKLLESEAIGQKFFTGFEQDEDAYWIHVDPTTFDRLMHLSVEENLSVDETIQKLTYKYKAESRAN